MHDITRSLQRRGRGKVTLTATALVGSPLYIPHVQPGNGSSPEGLITGLSMALDVIQSPGCADLIADDLQAISDRGGVVIDTGRIAESLGWDPTDPNRNQALLRWRSGCGPRRSRLRERQQSRWRGPHEQSVSRRARTSSRRKRAGPFAWSTMTRAEACRRIGRSLPNNRDRAGDVREGLDRFYDDG